MKIGVLRDQIIFDWLSDIIDTFSVDNDACVCSENNYRLKRPNRRQRTKLGSHSVNKKRIVCSPLHWTAITGQWHTYTFVGARKRWYKGKQSSQRLYRKRPNYSQTSLIRTLKALESVRTERRGVCIKRVLLLKSKNTCYYNKISKKLKRTSASSN